MSIISQNNTKSELSNSISSFFSKYHIGNLLRKCNANKEKGVPVIRIFMYKLCNVFKKASMYMQMKTDSYHESFSKNTYYRFLNSAKTNWLRFTSLLSKAVANTIEPLTSDDRINAFVIDDSLFERTSGKHTELASKVFDHCSMKFKTGYRLMTLGWTDGNTFLPVNSTLLASSKACNQYCQERSFDGRSIAAHRRKLAQMKGTDAMMILLKSAVAAGHKADYVLFDSWFSNPAQLLSIKALGLDSIAMIRKSSKIKYTYNGEKLSLNKIYGISKKRRGKSRYLLSVDVLVGEGADAIPARIVCVRNNKKRKEWIAFISTNATLEPEEIIRIYGKRWQIEIFFKTCKSTLNLIGECHSLSYDALTAHVAIVFARYLMIAIEQRKSEDYRTLGEIFYFLSNELEDITFRRSMQILMDAMIASIGEIFNVSNEQLSTFMTDFVSRLPIYLQEALSKIQAAA